MAGHLGLVGRGGVGGLRRGGAGKVRGDLRLSDAPARPQRPVQAHAGEVPALPIGVYQSASRRKATSLPGEGFFVSSGVQELVCIAK